MGDWESQPACRDDRRAGWRSKHERGGRRKGEEGAHLVGAKWPDGEGGGSGDAKAGDSYASGF